MRWTVLATLGAVALAGTATAQDRAVFRVSAAWREGAPAPGAAGTVVVTVEVKGGWHVNSSTPLEDYLIPTAVRLELPAGWSADALVYPAHREARFEFSEDRVAVFEKTFTVVVPLRVAPGAGP